MVFLHWHPATGVCRMRHWCAGHGSTIQNDINVCAFGCSGGLRPPSSIGDRRYNPGAQRAPFQGNAQELMSFCITPPPPMEMTRQLPQVHSGNRRPPRAEVCASQRFSAKDYTARGLPCLGKIAWRAGWLAQSEFSSPIHVSDPLSIVIPTTQSFTLRQPPVVLFPLTFTLHPSPFILYPLTITL